MSRPRATSSPFFLRIPVAGLAHRPLRRSENLPLTFVCLCCYRRHAVVPAARIVDRINARLPTQSRHQLSRNYAKALERVSKELEFFPKHLQHRSKQRLTKIHQYLIRMRKLKLKAKPKLVTINPKVCVLGQPDPVEVPPLNLVVSAHYYVRKSS